MILDHRKCTCRPGTVNKQFELYAKYGREAQVECLGGEPLLYAHSESGRLNSYTHIWFYDGLEDRATKRAAMVKDPGWVEFRDASQDARNRMVQETRIMLPAPFFRF